MYKMREKIYLSLFMFCVIFVHGIVGTFLEDDLRDSTNSLIRQKRVINRLPGQDVPLPSPYSTHTANIKLFNRIHCVGTILSLKTVITAARCINSDVSLYRVFAGSTYSRNGSMHDVIEKRMHLNHPVRDQGFDTGIALIYVHPTFELNGRYNIAAIGLHAGLLLPGMRGVVRGWGTYYLRGSCETKHKGRLREIEVSIINHRDCVNSFQRFFEITDAYFCTHDDYKQCAYTDAGAGFIIENSLAGIYLGSIDTGHDLHLKPDVFIMLQHSDNRQWILRNIEN